MLHGSPLKRSQALALLTHIIGQPEENLLEKYVLAYIAYQFVTNKKCIVTKTFGRHGSLQGRPAAMGHITVNKLVHFSKQDFIWCATERGNLMLFY